MIPLFQVALIVFVSIQLISLKEKAAPVCLSVLLNPYGTNLLCKPCFLHHPNSYHNGLR